MLYLWMIAGFFIELLDHTVADGTTGLTQMILGLIGALTAYTLIEGMCHAL